MLELDWAPTPSAVHPVAANAVVGAGWKGRNVSMGALLRMHIVHAPRPLDILQHLAQDVLSAVPSACNTHATALAAAAVCTYPCTFSCHIAIVYK